MSVPEGLRHVVSFAIGGIMIDEARFLRIKTNYGHFASWAVWADGSGKPKEGVGDLSIFEAPAPEGLLKLLNPDVVLVGLNISRPIQFPLGNFHDGRPSSMDYKIRYALKGTNLWGAYMTDIIKDFEQKASGTVTAFLRGNERFERENLELFHAELSHLGVVDPTLVTFGRDAFQILDRHFGRTHRIWRVPHYSRYVGKDVYRQEVAAVIESRTLP